MPALELKNLKMLLKMLLGLLSLVLLLVIAVSIYFKGRVPWGVYLADTYLGGKNYKEVEILLDETSKGLKEKKINIYSATADKNPLVFSLEELGLALAEEKLLQEIMELRYSLDLKEAYKFFTHSVHLPGYFNYTDEKLMKTLEQLQVENYVSPQNATIYAEGGKLKICPSRKGQRLKIEKTGEEILEMLSSWPAFPLKVYIEKEWLFPEKTVLHILKMGIKKEMATATTFFSSHDKNRNYNIALAAEKLDNVILAPGETFSFNKFVGEASPEAGFKEAPIIMHGRVVPGPGGGVCQVSSTLYQAALLAGVSIEERHNHGLPVGYLPPGYDATIAYDYLDLKFRNNKPCHILIHLRVSENSIGATIFGSPSPAEKIEVATYSLQKIVPPVEFREMKDKPVTYYRVIQEGKPGFVVETVRIFYENGQESRREHLGKDRYAPIPQIVAVGILPEKEIENKIEEKAKESNEGKIEEEVWEQDVLEMNP